MRNVVITYTTRTPVGKYIGRIKDISAEQLLSYLIKEARQNFFHYDTVINEVIVGNVLSPSPNIARVASLLSGLPYDVSAYSVNQLCGSSLRAVINAYQTIALGPNSVVIAGGTENMSQSPYYLPFDIRYNQKKHGGLYIEDAFEYASRCAQPPELFPSLNMGITAENIAMKYFISRVAQDRFAFESQIKYKKAMERGIFKDEICPIIINNVELIEEDEQPRPNISISKLSALKPVFLENGTVTAGNSAGINDGASLVVLMDEKYAIINNYNALVKIVGYSSTGTDPNYMGLGVVPALIGALEMAHISLYDLDLIEINEAFASQVLGCLIELGIDDDKEMISRINVNGGAIAHGHAVGNSGTRILTTLIHEMIRSGKKYGAAAMCVGGGQGVAIILQNCC